MTPATRAWIERLTCLSLTITEFDHLIAMVEAQDAVVTAARKMSEGRKAWASAKSEEQDRAAAAQVDAAEDAINAALSALDEKEKGHG